jgi:hypothetical protein
MEALKLNDLRRYPTLEVTEDFGELKVVEEGVKIYLCEAKDTVYYQMKNRDREWITEEFGTKEWNKWFN